VTLGIEKNPSLAFERIQRLRTGAKLNTHMVLQLREWFEDYHNKKKFQYFFDGAK
jgi:hypothetical protein